MESPTTISISPIKSEDIPDVANIYMLTCLLDNAMKFNYPTPQQFVQATIDTLEIRFEDPAWRAIKAVDTATTTISAWACWVTVLPGEKRARNEEGGFNAFLQGEIDGMLEKWTGGEKYISCKACFTLPEFQGRGMGKAMIKYGNEVADKEGLPIYLLASPAGFPLYQKYGFETLQNLDLDLRDWAKSDEKGYGNYRFRFMVRLPGSADGELKG